MKSLKLFCLPGIAAAVILVAPAPVVASGPTSGLLVDSNFGEYAAPMSAREKSFQDDWAAYLRKETGLERDRLAELLTNGRQPYFERTCHKPGDAQDFGLLQNTLSDIVLSGIPGHPAGQGEAGGRGRYLACLANSGLGSLKARIEGSISRAITSPNILRRGLTCDFSPKGASVPAEYRYSRSQISWYLPSSHAGRGHLGSARENPDGAWSPMTFGNVLLHELVHAGGVEYEPLAYAVHTCCGDAVNDRAKACQGLDVIVQQAPRIAGLAGPMGRIQLFMQPPLQFEQSDARAVAYLFYSELARAMPSLATSDQRAACVNANGRDSCMQQAGRAIQSTLNALLKPGGLCEEHLSGNAATVCVRQKPADYRRTGELMLTMLFPS